MDDDEEEIDLAEALNEMTALVRDRKFDLYDGTDGRITKL